jgi:hypothetical protein
MDRDAVPKTPLKGGGRAEGGHTPRKDSKTPLKDSKTPLTPLKDSKTSLTPLKDSVFSFLDSPRSPFKTILNFASLGNRGALSPSSNRGSPAQPSPAQPDKEPRPPRDKENHTPTPANHASDNHAPSDKQTPLDTTIECSDSQLDVTLESDDVYSGVNTASVGDKYASIASLDDEQDDEKWEERTELITRIDHEEYVECAKSILKDLVSSLPDHHDQLDQHIQDLPHPGIIPEILEPALEPAVSVHEDEDTSGMVSCNTSFRNHGIYHIVRFSVYNDGHLLAVFWIQGPNSKEDLMLFPYF